MKKIIPIAVIAILTSCTKTTQQKVWECKTKDYKFKIKSDTMPIIPTVNEFGNMVICDCRALN